MMKGNWYDLADKEPSNLCGRSIKWARKTFYGADKDGGMIFIWMGFDGLDGGNGDGGCLGRWSMVNG